MSPLTVTPFPALNLNSENSAGPREPQDFVDESVVRAVMRIQSLPVRQQSDFQDLVLSADDLDYAGWHAPQTLRITEGPFPHAPAESNSAPDIRLPIQKPELPKSRRPKQKLPQPQPAKPLPWDQDTSTRPEQIRQSKPASKTRNWLTFISGMVTLTLTAAIIASLLADSNFDFQNAVQSLFQLPAAAEGFE